MKALLGVANVCLTHLLTINNKVIVERRTAYWRKLKNLVCQII